MRKIFFIATIFFLAACGNKEIAIPENVLKQEKMITVLMDMHLAQAAVAMNAMNDTISHTLADYMPAILELHKITQQQFDTSMHFYTTNPALLDSIYKQVIDELSKKQGQADALN